MFVLGIAIIVIALIAGLLVGVKTWVIVVAGLKKNATLSTANTILT